MPNSKNQNEAPILKGLKEYHESKKVPFTVPSHKMGQAIDPDVLEILGAETFRNDIPLLIGVDDRKESKGYQEKAQQLAAAAYGADQCFFSTNGTSLSAHAAVLAVANSGDKIIIPRNAHHSLIAATILAEVHPVFIEPEYDPNWDLLHSISPKKLDELLKHHPDAKGVFVVSPDYYGVASDLKSLADVCHKHNKPFIVDEAWGPHFPFHPDFPMPAMKAGADLAMGSVHKTALALGQGSFYLLKGQRISKSRFTKAYDLFETTSPSSLIMGSMDGARRQLSLHGRKVFGEALLLARYARSEIAKIPQLKVLDPKNIDGEKIFGLDEIKLSIDLKNLGISGFEAGDWLWDQCNLAIELADHRRLMALISPGDDEQSIKYLINSIQKLVDWALKRKKKTLPDLPGENRLYFEIAMDPAQAYFSKHKEVPIKKAVGCIAGETISPYPPGIPRVIPGALITQDIVDYLTIARDAGMFQEDAEDTSLKKILVVDTTEAH